MRRPLAGELPLLLDVRNVSIDYVSQEGQAAHAVEDVSFTLREGEALGLVG